MEGRITNNYQQYISEVKQKLTRPFSEDTRLLYSMFPERGDGHFSVQLIDAQQPYVLFRQWRQDLADSIRLGIYQLHNISIDEQKIDIPAADYREIYTLLENKIEIEPLQGIMLDGVNHCLIIFRQQPMKFEWKDDAQIGAKIKEMISRLMRMID